MELTGATRISLFLAVIAFIAYRYTSMKQTKLTVDNVNSTYDYIIVGGGSAGCVLASRLSEDPEIRVLLLEAGGEETGNINISIPVASPAVFNTAWDWAYHTTPQKNSGFSQLGGENRHFWPRGKGIGGSNNLNALQYVRGSRHDFDEWKELGCDGWGYEDILPYFLKSEDMRVDDLKNSRYHNSGGPLAVTKKSDSPLGKRFVNAGKQLGFKEIDYNGKEQIGFAESQINVKHGTRVSTVVAFLRPAMGRTNLHVVVNAHVTTVIIEKKLAKGVAFIKNNRKHVVSANKEVILCAGVIGSPHILMLSGVGPKQHLEKFNIPVILDLPVGLNMEDHIYSFIPTTINSSEGFTGPKAESISSIAQYMVFGEGPLSAPLLPGTAFIKSSTCETRYPDLQFHLMAALPISENARVLGYESEGLFPETWTDGLLMATILLHPKSKGSVSLKSNYPFDYPNIDPNYFDLEEDVRKMIEAIRKGIELLKTKPFAEIGADFSRLNVPHCSHNEFLSDEQLKCFIQHFAATLYHPTSTCRMGSLNDKTSVVDPQLRVKGIRNLRVVDASVMPHVTSGNTNAPTIMIAEKAADMIRGIYSVAELRRKLNKHDNVGK
ncbi:DHGL-like protein [Mya arenaria]|uniref:DHGL-like protein n=1 Tax=Mya arenaria TaxID=6604 RepID=A0ABY7EKR8_MYAAR|nr:alcohol dehydrogenase [acceptor]-like [Mya arenaria]WAR09336.1 DHGL-like protein [Mya arenaria]